VGEAENYFICAVTWSNFFSRSLPLSPGAEGFSRERIARSTRSTQPRGSYNAAIQLSERLATLQLQTE